MSDLSSGVHRRPRQYIDWALAARLMVAGQTPTAAAAAIGVSENRFWRHFETSPHFRRLVQQAGKSRRDLALALQAAAGNADTAR